MYFLWDMLFDRLIVMDLEHCDDHIEPKNTYFVTMTALPTIKMMST